MNYELEIYVALARHFWPAIRPIFSAKLSKRCQKCILSENYTSIDSSGLCPECLNPTVSDVLDLSPEKQNQMEDELNSILKTMPLKGTRSFDAIVLFSGGKDSCHLVHNLRTHHSSIRLLALTVDNHFLSPAAKKNIECAIEKFDIPLLTLKPEWPFVKNLFRATLKSVNQRQHYPPTDLIDGHLTFLTAFKVALEFEIPYIFSGISRAQSEHVLSLKDFKFRASHIINLPIHGLSTKDLFLSGPTSYLGSHYDTTSNSSITYLSPLYVWNESEEDIIQKVTRLGLIDQKTSHPLATNNELIPVASYVESSKFGFTKFEIEFARMIRNGKANRNFWFNIFQMLEFSGRTGLFVNRSIRTVLKKLDLSSSELGVRI